MENREYMENMWDYISNIKENELRQKELMLKFGHVETAKYIEKAISLELMNDTNVDIVIEAINLGYRSANEEEYRNSWKLVANKMISSDILTDKELLSESNELLQVVLKTRNLDLIDVLCKKLKSDDKVLKFSDNDSMWKTIEFMKNIDNYDNVLPIFKVLSSNNFKFKEGEIENMEKGLQKNIDDTMKSDERGINIPEEQASHCEDAKNGLKDFKKIIKKYNFSPNINNKKLTKVS